MNVVRLLILFILILSGSRSWSASTLVYSFNSSASYDQCTSHGGKGGTNTFCVKRACANHTAVDAPMGCFSKGYIDLVDAETYKKEQEANAARIQELENQLLQYKQELARGQIDVMETMIQDPQFRSALLKQLKADLKR
ncbi:hypothetical protein [Bdellovibrio bacteriovorus]|uniref:hypothetical protein n=1 Tax=Bdellovibrio bacteriovorus TaxID=959 RepID=UPI0035A72992